MEKLDHYHVLITGPSGTGKTYFASELGRLGYPVQDGDHIPGLGYFVDNKTREFAEFNPLGDIEWFTNHTYIWNREVLEKYLEDNPRIILCGGTTNYEEVADLFDKIFYLKVDKELILKNLRDESRENVVIKHIYTLNHIVTGKQIGRAHV